MRFHLKKIAILLITLFVFVISFVLILKLNLLENFFEPHAGSCLILEEKYCKTVKLIDNPNNAVAKIAVFNLPKGALIFAPADGYYSNVPTFFYKDSNSGMYKTYPGSTINVSKDQLASSVTSSYNFIYFKEVESAHQEKIKRGEIIATVSDKKIDFLGNFNLVFSATDRVSMEGKTGYKSKDLSKIFKINE